MAEEDIDKKIQILKENPALHDTLRITQMIQQMFNEDTDTIDLEERKEMKEVSLQKQMDEFFLYLKELSGQYSKKGKMATAISYALDLEQEIRNYLLDPRYELSNNRAERFVKPFVIARKNFLFSNTERGAKASAIQFSIVQTAMLNGLDPDKYLTYVLTRFMTDGMSDQVISEVLPYSKTLPIELKSELITE